MCSRLCKTVQSTCPTPAPDFAYFATAPVRNRCNRSRTCSGAGRAAWRSLIQAARSTEGRAQRGSACEDASAALLAASSAMVGRRGVGHFGGPAPPACSRGEPRGDPHEPPLLRSRGELHALPMPSRGDPHTLPPPPRGDPQALPAPPRGEPQALPRGDARAAASATAAGALGLPAPLRRGEDTGHAGEAAAAAAAASPRRTTCSCHSRAWKPQPGKLAARQVAPAGPTSVKPGRADACVRERLAVWSPLCCARWSLQGVRL